MSTRSREPAVDLWRELVALARSWWRVDRIRVAPGEGELLRLRPGAILRVDGAAYEVVGRAVGANADGPYVAYQCEGPGGQAELRVRPPGERGARSVVHWSGEGRPRSAVSEEVDLVYFPSGPGGES